MRGLQGREGRTTEKTKTRAAARTPTQHQTSAKGACRSCTNAAAGVAPARTKRSATGLPDVLDAALDFLVELVGRDFIFPVLA